MDWINGSADHRHADPVPGPDIRRHAGRRSICSVGWAKPAPTLSGGFPAFFLAALAVQFVFDGLRQAALPGLQAAEMRTRVLAVCLLALMLAAAPLPFSRSVDKELGPDGVSAPAPRPSALTRISGALHWRPCVPSFGFKGSVRRRHPLRLVRAPPPNLDER